MTQLPERYPDLLDEHASPARLCLVSDLDAALARCTLPADLCAPMDGALQARMAELHVRGQTTPARRSRLRAWARRRRSIVAGILLAAAICAGGAYAASPLLDQIFPPHFGQEVNLSQGACGFTMTLGRVYADANRIAIGYTLTGPAGRTFAPEMSFFATNAAPTLTDAHGTHLMMLMALGGVVEGPAQAPALWFDASAIGDRSNPLRLRLTVPQIAMTEQLGNGKPATVPCEKYYSSNVPPRFRPAGGPIRVVAVNGPFTFNLTVPLTTSVREADPHQVAQAAGEQVVLEKVVVTPTDTRVYLWRTAGAGRDRGRPELVVATSATVAPYGRSFGRPVGAGQSAFEAVPLWIQAATGVSGYADDVSNAPGVVAYDVMGPALYDYHGAWTLVVPTRGGSVTFHFTVPDAAVTTATPVAGVATAVSTAPTTAVATAVGISTVPTTAVATTPFTTTTPATGTMSTPQPAAASNTPLSVPSGTPQAGGASETLAALTPVPPTSTSVAPATTTPHGSCITSSASFTSTWSSPCGSGICGRRLAQWRSARWPRRG